MKIIIFLMSFFIISNASAQIIEEQISDTIEEDKSVVFEQKLERLENQFNLFSKGLLKSNADASKKRGETASPEIFLDQMQFRIDKLEQNAKSYLNEIERLSNRIDTLSKRLDTINADNKVRFEMLEKMKVSPPSVVSQEVEEKKTENKEVKQQSINENPDELYKDAIDFIKKNKYDQAENNLKIIIGKYPKHALASNAMYWLGETYYVRADYKNAISTFADGIKKYPNGSKGVDSLLKLGFSYKNLKKNKEACTVFSSISLKYPKAPKDLLNKAKKERTELKCDEVKK